MLVLLAIAAGPAAALELEGCRISAGPAFPGIKARCGGFERPLNPDQPAAGSIGLSVAVVPALTLGAAPDPLVPLAGGPGSGRRERRLDAGVTAANHDDVERIRVCYRAIESEGPDATDRGF